jgi:hypothetical protein
MQLGPFVSECLVTGLYVERSLSFWPSYAQMCRTELVARTKD